MRAPWHTCMRCGRKVRRKFEHDVGYRGICRDCGGGRFLVLGRVILVGPERVEQQAAFNRWLVRWYRSLIEKRTVR